jgi:hypothetical protein
MGKLALVFTLSIAASTANAVCYVQPVATEAVTADASASAGDQMIVPLLLIIALAIAASKSAGPIGC